MDSAELMQYLLIFVISSLTTILIIIGIQVIKILKEVRNTLIKSNSMLDDAKKVTSSVAEPVEAASDFLMGLKKGFKLVDVIDKILERRSQKESEDDK